MKKSLTEKDMRALVADALRIAADAIEKGLEAMEEQVAEEETKAPEAKPPMENAAKPATTIDEVRAFLTEKSRAGKKEQVQKALASIDAKRISDVKPDDYGDLIARVEYFCGDLDDQLEGADA